MRGVPSGDAAGVVSNGDTATQRGTNPAATQRRGVVLEWATGVRRRRGGPHPDGGMEGSPEARCVAASLLGKALAAGAPLLGKADGDQVASSSAGYVQISARVG